MPSGHSCQVVLGTYNQVRSPTNFSCVCMSLQQVQVGTKDTVTCRQIISGVIPGEQYQCMMMITMVHTTMPGAKATKVSTLVVITTHCLTTVALFLPS